MTKNYLGNKKGKNRPSLLNFSGNSYQYEKAKKQELHNQKYAEKKWKLITFLHGVEEEPLVYLMLSSYAVTVINPMVILSRNKNIF